MTYNPKIKNTAANKVTVDADINATNINLGVAEDNDDPTNIQEDPTYLDGLFSFDTETTVGVAIDRINEVLGKLAPPAAESLDSLNSSATPGESQRLASGPGDESVSLLEHNADDSRNLESVAADKGFFQVISDGNVGGSKYQRLGIFSETKSLTFFLNGTESENLQGTEVNYPNFAYDTTATNPDDPNIQVWINGAEIDLVQYPNVKVTHLTKNQPATFASGETFDGFIHSVTKIEVNEGSLWRNGHNYIQAKYVQPDGTTIDTSYADWFYAPDERTGAPLTFSPDEAQVTIDTGDTKHISGIKYYFSPTQFTIKPPANGQITNYAIHCYPENYGVSANEIGATSGVVASSTNFADTDLDFTNNTLDISEFNTTLLNNRRLNNEKIKLSMQVNNNLGRSASKIYESTDLYMFDSFNTNDGTFTYNGGTQSTVLDDFNHEGYRVDSSYSSWNPETGDPASIVSWDSTAVLIDGNAALHNSKLYHPQFLSTLGSINNPAQSTQPNFASSFPSPAYYYRKLKKNTDANNTMQFVIQCSTGVVFGTADEVNKWSIEVQNKTGTWLDVCKDSDVAGGVGTGTLLSGTSGENRELFILWAAARGGGPLADNVWLMRIKAPATASNEYIEKITIISA